MSEDIVDNSWWPCLSAYNCVTFGLAADDGSNWRCDSCKYNKDKTNVTVNSAYISMDGKPHIQDQHKAPLRPRLEAKNKPKDKLRQKINEDASRAELDGFKRAVKKSENSGRTRRDGDYSIGECLIDYKKYNTKSIKIDPEELYKAQRDAKRSAKKIAIIVSENENGERFAIMTEEDLHRLLL